MAYTVEFAESVKEQLKKMTAQQRNEIIVLTADDKPIAAIVSLKDVDRESLSLSTDPAFIEIIERARKEFKAGKKLSFEEIKREVLE